MAYIVPRADVFQVFQGVVLFDPVTVVYLHTLWHWTNESRHDDTMYPTGLMAILFPEVHLQVATLTGDEL